MPIKISKSSFRECNCGVKVRDVTVFDENTRLRIPRLTTLRSFVCEAYHNNIEYVNMETGKQEYGMPIHECPNDIDPADFDDNRDEDDYHVEDEVPRWESVDDFCEREMIDRYKD